MNEMVERVARAMFDAEWLDSGAEEKFPGKADHSYDTWKRKYRLEARAAIEAMREPTVKMGLAGFDQLASEASPHAAEACWQAMLMEALKEP